MEEKKGPCFYFFFTLVLTVIVFTVIYSTLIVVSTKINTCALISGLVLKCLLTDCKQK